MEETLRFSDYRRLNRASREIRLLQIFLDHDDALLQTRFETYSLDKTPRYHALSYEWGRTGDTHPITVNSIRVHIRENAGALLRSMRLIYGEILVWIDCLCINQRDNTERSHQVELMGDIYREAAVVHAWLGPSTYTSSLVFDTAWELKFAKPRPYEKKYSPWGDMSWDPRLYWQRFTACKVRPAIRALLSRSYWTRLWILQEMILAKEVIFTCGSDIIPFEDLMLFCELYGMRSSYLDDAAFSNGWRTLDKVARFRPKNDRPRWESMFTFFRHNRCSNPKDKVYGFRQMLTDPNTLPVDYSKPVLEVYMDLLRTGLLCDAEGIGYARSLIASMDESLSSLAWSTHATRMDFAPIRVIRSFCVAACTDIKPGSNAFDLQVSFKDLGLLPISCSVQPSTPAARIAVGDIISYFGYLRGDKEPTTILVLRKQRPGKFTSIARVDQFVKHFPDQDYNFGHCHCEATAGPWDGKVIEINRMAVSDVLHEMSVKYQ